MLIIGPPFNSIQATPENSLLNKLNHVIKFIAPCVCDVFCLKTQSDK